MLPLCRCSGGPWLLNRLMRMLFPAIGGTRIERREESLGNVRLRMAQIKHVDSFAMVVLQHHQLQGVSTLPFSSQGRFLSSGEL